MWGFLTSFLILLFTSDDISSYSNTYNISVYPLNKWVFDTPIHVYWDRRTFIEAHESCISKNMKLYHGWRELVYHDFVLAHALQQNSDNVHEFIIGFLSDSRMEAFSNATNVTSDFVGMWIANIKPVGSDLFLRFQDCSTEAGEPNVITNTTADRLCYMLNATADLKENIYGVSCHLQFAYACQGPRHLYYDLTDSYILNNNTRLLQSSLRKRTKYSNETLDGCINRLFSSKNVLAEYEEITPGNGACQLYFCDSYDLPVEVTLVNDTEDTTIITGAIQAVVFSEDASNITTTSSLSICDIPTTTSNDDATTSRSDNETCCICTEHHNITNEEVEEKLKEIQRELLVKTKTLSSSKRKLISAPDDRTSSKGIGLIAIIILALVGSVIVLSDLAFYKRYLDIW